MNEITRIHLARTPYNIEVSAKKSLEKYIVEIRKKMQADDDDIYEIEARMVEILAEQGVVSEKTIMQADIVELRKQLGEPRDFASDESQEAVSEVAPTRRLMRDVDRGWLGGVSAGIAAYFGINPIWIRILMIISPFMSFGTSVVIYVLLWIVMPPARTAAEKLQMHGEPVTLAALKSTGSTIGENVGSIVKDAQKPLVVVVRIVLGIGFAVAAAIAAFVTAAAVAAMLFSFAEWTPWILVASAAAASAGLLFMILMIILSYMSFAWRSSTGLIVSIVVIIILGILAASVAIGAGVYEKNQGYSSFESRNQYVELPK